MRVWRTHRARGFTLVELLVSVAILSGLVLALTAALRTFAQTEIRLDERVLRDEDARVTSQFLGAVFQRAAAHRWRGAEGAITRLLFVGRPDEVVWIGVMPARPGVGGLHYLRLTIDRSGAAARLVLQYQPYDGLDTMPQWSAVEPHVIAAVEDATLRYRDSRPAEPAWTAAWPHPERLPDGVALSVQAGGHAWPDVIVPMRVLSSGVGGGGGFVVGGG